MDFVRNAWLRMSSGLQSEQARFVWAMAATTVLCFVANGYSYCNFDPIHDAVNHTFEDAKDANWQTRLGRFLIPVYLLIRGGINIPWVIGLLSMLYLGVIVYVIVRLLDLRSPLLIALAAGFMSANLFMTEINSVHSYYADVFIASCLFAVLATWCALFWERPDAHYPCCSLVLYLVRTLSGFPYLLPLPCYGKRI